MQIKSIAEYSKENVATVRSNKLLARLEIDDPDVILREKRARASCVADLCWFSSVPCSAVTDCHSAS